MSRSPTMVLLADGTCLYGLFNDTVGVMQPRVFRTAAERDVWWESGAWYMNWSSCECQTREYCIAFSGQDELTSSSWVVQICLEHLYLDGLLSFESDISFLDMALAGRDQIPANPKSLRDRLPLPQVPRSLKHICIRIFEAIHNRAPEPVELESLIDFIDG